MPLLVEVREQLQALNMNHAAQTLADLVEKAQLEEWSPLHTINALLNKEQDERLAKARNRRMKDAGFPQVLGKVENMVLCLPLTCHFEQS